jgi:hypothetical protein
MSIETTMIAMVGANIGYQYERDFNEKADDDDAFYEAFEECNNYLSAKQGEFVVISDCMSGEYLYVGILIGKAELDNCESISVNAGLGAISLWIEKARKEVLEKMGLEIEPRLLVFTHYT